MVIIATAALAVLLGAWMVKSAGWRAAGQRLGGAILVTFLVTFATSALIRLVGVDDGQREALNVLGVSEQAGPCLLALGTAADTQSVQECVVERGLDGSVVEQYRVWATDFVTGDLGLAFYKNGETMTDMINQRGPRSLLLFAYSQMLALGIAVPLGMWAAYQAGRRARPKPPRWALGAAIATMGAVGLVAGWSVFALVALAAAVPVYVFFALKGGPGADATVNVTAFILLSLPSFVIGESLRYVFAIERDWYHLEGYKPLSDGLAAHLGSVWLPALVLGLVVAPIYVRLLRADMRKNLQEDFVLVAKSKGLANRSILLRHVLRPSSLTLLTVAGLNIAQLVNGAIVIEFIYDLDGIGSWFLEAVARREFFAVQTMVAIISVLFVLANTVIDLLYVALDPRVRAEGRNG